MPNNYFKFKQFTIYQNNCAMKVGTDGVLLGAFARIKGIKTILDIGTGTGLIALMLAQRSNANITAIEIEKQASNQAKINIEKSIFKKQINIKNISLQRFYKKNIEKFDLIVSNPPYFQNSYKSDTNERTIARHTTELTYNELISISAKILNNNGYICIIIPKDEEGNIEKISKINKLFIIEKINIKPTSQKPSKRIIITFSKIKKLLKESEIIIETTGRHNYSKEYINLTKDFYLNF